MISSFLSSWDADKVLNIGLVNNMGGWWHTAGGHALYKYQRFPRSRFWTHSPCKAHQSLHLVLYFANLCSESACAHGRRRGMSLLSQLLRTASDQSWSSAQFLARAAANSIMLNEWKEKLCSCWHRFRELCVGQGICTHVNLHTSPAAAPDHPHVDIDLRTGTALLGIPCIMLVGEATENPQLQPNGLICPSKQNTGV
jgi:hypothetical protein